MLYKFFNLASNLLVLRGIEFPTMGKPLKANPTTQDRMFPTQWAFFYPVHVLPEKTQDLYCWVHPFFYGSSRFSCGSLFPPKLPTPFSHPSSPFYCLPLVGFPSWQVAFPKLVGPSLSYIPNQMGPTARSWNDSIGTYASLQILVRQVDFPKALYHALGNILWWSVLTMLVRAFHHCSVFADGQFRLCPVRAFRHCSI